MVVFYSSIVGQPRVGMVVFYSSIVGQPRVGISYSKQYGYILEQIRMILSMNSVYDMVVSFLRHGEVSQVCHIFRM